jgi:hypothetical protein
VRTIVRNDHDPESVPTRADYVAAVAVNIPFNVIEVHHKWSRINTP